VEATRGYGAEVVLHGDVHAAFEKLEEIRAGRGLTLIHPFDDPMLIAGHGTVGLEILEDVDDVDAVICGIGGGGLSGGLGVALADTDVRLFGVEPEGAATMTRALEAGAPVRLDTVETIAEGLAPPFVGALNLLAAQRHVEAVAVVTDDQIRDAMRLLLERTKNVVEPSGAAALAGLLAGAFPISPGSRVVVVVSGGNVDLHRLGELLG
jgi:threonine dehydratase